MVFSALPEKALYFCTRSLVRREEPFAIFISLLLGAILAHGVKPSNEANPGAAASQALEGFPENGILSEGDEVMKKKRIAVRMLIFLLIILLFIFLFHAAAIWNYADVNETRRADAAIVLGAAASESGPSPVFKERLNQGILMYCQGYVNKLILTGGTAEGLTRSDAAIGGAYVMEQGIPREDVLLEAESRITEENLKNASLIMRQDGLSSALIISDPLHMKRAMLMAGDAGITAYSCPTSTTRYQSTQTRLRFLVRGVFYYVGYRLVRLFR